MGTGKKDAPGDREQKENFERVESSAPESRIQLALDYVQDGQDGEERTLRDYPAVLLRYWPLILACVLLGASISWYKTTKTTKLYRSTSLINIGTYVPPVDGPTGDILKEETRRQTYANTQIRLLRSYTLAERVLRDHPQILESVSPKLDLQANESIPVPTLQAYLGSISFYALPETTLVEIYATTDNPQKSANFANAHAKSFTALVKERRQKAANVNLQFLQERYEEASKQLEQAERARIAYAERNAISVSSNEVAEQNYASKYSGLVSNLNRAIAEKSRAEAEYRELRRSRGVSGLSGGGGMQNQQVKLAQLRAEYDSVVGITKNRRHPIAQQLKTQVETLEDTLEELGKQQIRNARSQYLSASDQVSYLKSEFERLRNEQIEMSRHKVEHDRLKQAVRSAREVQKTIATRLEDALINAQSNQETVALVDSAFAPNSHISPNMTSNVSSGALVGLLLGLVLALLLDYFDTRVHSLKDLQYSVQAPVLGYIPEFSKTASRSEYGAGKRGQKEAPVGAEHSQQVFAPSSAESESVRSILATLSGTLPNYGPRIVLVTSGQKGDGKTTLAVNLAVSLAQVNERTLLIDGDLRLPSVHKYFGVERTENGLSDCLGKDVDASKVIKETEVENLSVMPAGHRAANPTALLRSNKMSDLLLMMSEEYDYIIVDSPPVGPVGDALWLARYADGVAVVVRSGETSKAVAEAAVSKLRQVGANILGLVLNNTQKPGSYWKKRYHYDYYHNNPESDQKNV